MDKRINATCETVTPFTPTHRVNYDDPRWKKIDSAKYPWHCNPNLRIKKHFPNIRTGQADVVYECVIFDHEPTIKEAMIALTEAGLDRPDRAETDTFLDESASELAKHPIIGICGTVSDDKVGCVYEYVDGRCLNRRDLRSRLNQSWRVLGVRRK